MDKRERAPLELSFLLPHPHLPAPVPACTTHTTRTSKKRACRPRKEAHKRELENETNLPAAVRRPSRNHNLTISPKF